MLNIMVDFKKRKWPRQLGRIVVKTNLMMGNRRRTRKIYATINGGKDKWVLGTIRKVKKEARQWENIFSSVIVVGQEDNFERIAR